jgi:tRNA-specific 2-thiouridylase
VGDLTKAEVRERAAALGLRTAAKPDSQDVCFIQTAAGRQGFLEGRIDLTPGRVVDDAGRQVGEVDAVELVTVGQRRGLGLRRQQTPSFVTEVDVGTATVTVGAREDLLDEEVVLTDVVWADAPVAGPVLAQCSAHGEARSGVFTGGVLAWDSPQSRVAPGQSVVLYDGDEVLGGGIAT